MEKPAGHQKRAKKGEEEMTQVPMKSITESTTLPDVAYAKEWGKLAKDAKIIPGDLNELQAAAVVQTGRELGLQPLQSLRNMSFINGRITMSVQLQLALAKQGGVRTPKGWLVEKDGKCTVTLERGTESVTCEYTMDDAKKAGLVRSGGNYDKYARQMLRWRAIGDALRLIAPDLVMGLLAPEEAASIEPLNTREVVPFPEPTPGEQVVEVVPTPGPEPAPVQSPPPGYTPDAAVVPAGVPAEAPVKDTTISDAIRAGMSKVAADNAKETKPAPHKKGMPGFLQVMAEIKAVMHNLSGADTAYYNVLQSFGLKHANEVKDTASMKAIYRAARVRASEMTIKSADDEMSKAVGDE